MSQLRLGTQIGGNLAWHQGNLALVPSDDSLKYKNLDVITSLGGQTINGPLTATAFVGNASTATRLQTARTINGTSFNGTANITTANWGTARNITIGNTAKSVNGSANISWDLTEIGAVNATPINSNNVDADLIKYITEERRNSIVRTTHTYPLLQGHRAILNLSAINGTGMQIAARSVNNELAVRSIGETETSTWSRLYNDDYHPMAEKLKTARNITVGNQTRAFDGTQNISFSFSDMNVVDWNSTTDARDSNSKILVLQAKAMRDHVESGDHDNRYIRANEIVPNLKFANDFDCVQIKEYRGPSIDADGAPIVLLLNRYVDNKASFVLGEFIGNRGTGTAFPVGFFMNVNSAISVDKSEGFLHCYTKHTIARSSNTSSSAFNVRKVKCLYNDNYYLALIITSGRQPTTIRFSGETSNIQDVQWVSLTQVDEVEDFDGVGTRASKVDFDPQSPLYGNGEGLTSLNASELASGTIPTERLTGTYNINASTATALQTGRLINGTSFNGTANITTANWGANRSITIGNTAKSVNGSANVAWSLAEIGAVNKAGDTMTGSLKIQTTTAGTAGGLNLVDADNRRLFGMSTAYNNGHAVFYISSTLDETKNGIVFRSLSEAGTGLNDLFKIGMDGKAISYGGFQGNGSLITDLNASALVSGTVPSARLTGTYNINASTATALQTGRLINGTSFNGTANITTANWGANRSITIGNTAKSVNGSANVAWSLTEIGALAVNGKAVDSAKLNDATEAVDATANTIVKRDGNGDGTFRYLRSNIANQAAIPTTAGITFRVNNTTDNYVRFCNDKAVIREWLGVASTNAASATKLETARLINGTSFDGTANITTANWGVGRVLTIGGSGKTINGSGNVTWTLAEIGAVAPSGNVATATKLQTARNITIGNTTRAFDGTTNVAWTLDQIGAVNKAGDTMTGRLSMDDSLTGQSSSNPSLYGFNLYGSSTSNVAYGMNLINKGVNWGTNIYSANQPDRFIYFTQKTGTAGNMDDYTVRASIDVNNGIVAATTALQAGQFEMRYSATTKSLDFNFLG